MGWRNPPIPWSELEQRLSDVPGRPRVTLPGADGGDSPAWSRKRQPYEAPPLAPPPGAVPYAELHCHSNFSFLDGASHPEQLAEEADRLGLEALALTDHDGLYGVVRFAEAARAVGLPTVFGAEITVRDPSAIGRHARTESDTQQQISVASQDDLHAPDPHGQHLLVLAD